MRKSTWRELMYLACRIVYFLTPVAAVLFSCLFSIPPQAHATAGEDLESRFRDEAPRRWAELMSLAKDYQGSLTLTEYDLSPAGERKLLSKLWIEWKWNEARRYALSLTETTELHDPKSIDCNILVARNSRYIFQLSRTTPRDNWVLSNLQIDPDSNSLKDFPGAKLIEDLWKANCWGLRLSEEWLTNLLTKPGFRIHKISRPNQAEDQLVHITFEWPLKDRFNTTFSGWMMLDPEHYWMIREYEYRISYQPNSFGEDVLTTRKFTYDYDRRGFPIAVKHVDRDKFIDIATKTVKRTKETVREVKLVEEKDPAEEAFTLSAFGLPEPLGVQVGGSSNRLYLWVSLAGVFALTFGVFFIWRARRARHL